MRSWRSPQIPALATDTSRLQLWDTATGRRQSVGGDTAQSRMYVCGITPYDATHMGHAFTYVTFDLVNRVWRDTGQEVLYVQNVTDVDDPLLERAEQTGVDWRDLANDQIDLFRADMEALRVLPPDHYVPVTEFLDPVAELIESMMSTGLLYQIDGSEGDWYFQNAKAPHFGSLSHLDSQQATTLFAERGGDPDRPGKRDPLDCLVWRQARPGEPAWDSPLGRGRPGWHIECTAIALTYLGKNFDIQGGGSDLVFPHHEMCAAQAFAATGEPLAQTYVHSAMVGLDGEKMSKSKGNLVLVSTLRKNGVDPAAIRLALLNHHYRTDWFWSDDDLTTAQERLARWSNAAQQSAGAPAADTLTAIRAALRDDLCAPAALQAMDRWATATNEGNQQDPDAPATMKDAVDALLGIDLTKRTT